MISVSNIAWDTSMDDSVSQILHNGGVTLIDIAPPKYFRDLASVSISEIEIVKKFWKTKKIEPLGMQSLLFGTQGLNVFGAYEVREALLKHLTNICKVGGVLGATKIVFGSPKNRDRSNLSDSKTLEIATEFFRQLGEIAKSEDVTVCLEPNPACYQSNFMMNSLDTAEIVNKVNHNNIRMQLDTGAMAINNESPEEILKIVAPLIHHIHISEPQLVPLNINNKFHKKAAEAIQAHLPNMPMTIEMLTTSSATALQEIEASIKLVNSLYQGS